MFPQIVTTKKPDGRTYRYLHIVESYRDGNTVKKRRIASLGNIDAYSEKEILQIIEKLESLLQHRARGSAEDLEPHQTVQFGVPYVVQFLWDQIGLTDILRDALKDRDVTFDVARYIQAMVIGRLVDPSSKLHLFETLENLYLPESGEPWQLQHFYRALDYIMDIKPELERALYTRLTDLLSFRLSLVLYDVTSTHVTGHHCPIAQHGYSRTHRPDLEQVELGLLVTPEGLPITHEVFPGNTADKQTVPQILERLRREFAVDQCVFVGDRGMVTERNISLLREAGFPYIVGYHKRGRIVSDQLLEKFQDLSRFASIQDNLWYLEVPASEVDDDEKEPDTRYILCYNPVKAEQDAAYRESALEEAQRALDELSTRLTQPRRGRKLTMQGVMLKVADILTRRGMEAFFEVEYDGGRLHWTRVEEAIRREVLRDGKFIVKTNTTLSADEVVRSYKTLMGVERAFREIKNSLEVGPMYHWNERRVRGHIFVCVLAYLFEQELQVLYRRSLDAEMQKAMDMTEESERESKLRGLEKKRYTGAKIVQELGRWGALKASFLGKTFLSVPPAPPIVADVMKRLGIPHPSKMIELAPTN
nr:IS1634 family transposase [Alicyclobacillus hesperidum]